jgi:hypothetical protein
VVSHTCEFGYELPTISKNVPLEELDYKTMTGEQQLDYCDPTRPGAEQAGRGLRTPPCRTTIYNDQLDRWIVTDYPKRYHPVNELMKPSRFKMC